MEKDPQLCPDGQRLSDRCKDLITDGNGIPTLLYWHISGCDKCAELRKNLLEIDKTN